MKSEVIVSISLGEETFLVGRLWFNERNGRESASFEYDKKWLSHPERFALEPLLTLTKGAFYTQKSLFGAVGDSAPDRWGRMLMRRAEVDRAKGQNIQPKTLLEKDYLLGVSDISRQGALRFSFENEPSLFLNPKSSVPPLVFLPKLLSATEKVIEDKESEEDLRLLLAPGSSLGGARPKASILDRDGSLAIAKFPQTEDDFNTVLWEAVALELAKYAGIKTPSWRIEHSAGKNILIIKRFDRQEKERIPFLSAMSMLGAEDNEFHSYLEIAYSILQHGASPEKDLAELWRRIVFSIMIANTDDHLRNHAFIYERFKGWRLSPIYDVNPTPLDIKPRILTTAIDFEDTSASLKTALSVIKEFRLSKIEANSIIEEVGNAVKQWREVASKIGLSKRECDRMSSAFEYQD